MNGGFILQLLFRFGVLLVSLFEAYRQDYAAAPGQASPEFVTVTKVDKQKGMLGFEYHCQRPVHEEQIQVRNGKRVKQTTIRYVNERRDFLVSLTKVRVYDTKGQWLWPVAAMERLKTGATMLKSADGNKINPRYLSALRPDVLILVLPTEDPAVFSEELAPDKK